MSDPISISEAKTQLSRLVARAERGEEITIRRGSRAVVKIVSIASAPRAEGSPVGALKDQIWLSDEFDELGPEWAPYM